MENMEKFLGDTQGLDLVVFIKRCSSLYNGGGKRGARSSCKRDNLRRLADTRNLVNELKARIPESLKAKAGRLLDFRPKAVKGGSLSVFRIVRDGTLGIAGVQVLKSGLEGGFDDREIAMLGAAWSPYIPESFPVGIWGKPVFRIQEPDDT